MPSCSAGDNPPMPGRRSHPRPARGSGDAVAKYLGAQQAAVMSILWERGSATVREVLEQLGGRVAYTTAMTMMVRLYERGFLDRESEGRGFRYRPTKTRDQFIADLAGSLLDRLVADFGDAALVQILETADRLDPDRIAELRRRLADA
jgi:predicted transcriptional regulator